LEDAQPVIIDLPISNVDQAVGTMLGNELTKRYGAAGLPEATIDIRLTGSAGQSFAAFVPKGIKLTIDGDSNDYVGKGLSGGTVVIRPDRTSVFPAEKNIIAGNVIGYGATSGKLFLRGIVGERFMVRNSGAIAVSEGCGDHALEYMTGGLAVILGSTGRNLGAGMSGGIAYVYRLRADHVNQEALSAGELKLSEPTDEDKLTLKELLVEHVDETGSTLAGTILENFDSELTNFTKVLPRDFDSVQQILIRAKKDGTDPDGDVVWQEILEVTNG
jgi:glutamate synthase (NADPH/NADH) large chain